VISAIVLAAGESSRFGGCKQLAPIDGRTLLQHVLDSVAASRVDDVLVVLGAHADAIAPRIDACSIVNAGYAAGMSTSIQAGLRALPESADAAMIVLGDEPFIAPATLDLLIATYERTGAPIVIPTYDGARGNPVIIGRSLFAEVMELRGDVGCRVLFERHPQSIVTVPVEDRGVITDIDTIEDLDACRMKRSS
jgi:molybdenum cofactor cytidylyltransferase